jgi:hypothetical protein
LLCRRLEGQFVSNTVGLVDVDVTKTSEHITDYTKIKTNTFYWKSDMHGTPKEVFSPMELLWDKSQYREFIDYRGYKIDRNQKTNSWPIAGISIVSQGQGSRDDVVDTRVVVMVSVIAPISGGSIMKRDENVKEQDDDYDVIDDIDDVNIVDAAVAFKELFTAAMVVLNPHDPPNIWKTELLTVVPEHEKNADLFNW